jgi:uncharacterized protein
MAVSSKEARANPALRVALLEARNNIGYWLKHLPLKPGVSPLRMLPQYERWALDLQSHAVRDEYWHQRGYAIRDYYQQHADVPTIYFGSWYDSYARATTENFIALRRLKQSAHLLIMGPWLHGVRADEQWAGDVYFGPDAIDSYDSLRLRWFDQWLKHVDTGITRESAVRIFVMGTGSGRKVYDVLGAAGRIDHGGYWRSEREWPLARARNTSFYLHAGGKLSTQKPEVRFAATTYQFDPREPVPTVGGNISVGFEIMPGGGFDQRARASVTADLHDPLPLAARPDVVVFQTAALESDLEVTGSITANLWVSSSALDTDFTVKIIDVYPASTDYPDGYALNLTDSIMRARFRDSFTKPELMAPNEVYQLNFPLYPISNVFKQGHRIRVDVSSSNFPRFDVNPNTGGTLGETGGMVAANNTVHHDADRPSHLVLPVISH